MKTWRVVSYFFGGIIRNTWAMDHGGSWQWSQMLMPAAFMFIVSRSCSSVGNFTCPTCIAWSQSAAPLSTLRWKAHSIVKMHKKSKGAWHSITNHDFSSFPWNHTSSTRESPLILRAVEKPTLSRTTECWLGGWMAECLLHSLRYLSTSRSSSIHRIFHFDFNKMLARQPDFCIKSLSCRYHSPMSCENSGWSLSVLRWVLEKHRALFKVRNCWKFGNKSCDAKSGINSDELSFAQHFSSCQDAVSAPGKQFERKTQERIFIEQNDMNNQTMFWLVSGNMTFAIQIQELLFNLPSWNAGWAWWMLGIALAQTVSVIKSCRMHREVQNHFTNVKQLSVKIEAHL